MPVTVVAYNGRYVGNGSNFDTVSYNGSPVLKVESNLPNNAGSSALIENLVIDGINPSNNSTGILLDDVCNCLVRNVTIKNCDVGIRVKASNYNLSYVNRFEHIRMINVKTGILFEGTNNTNKDFSYTTIDGVGISLTNVSSAVGIKVGNGNTYANLYNAYVKAMVWLGESNGKGLEINGQLKSSLVNFEVEKGNSDPNNNNGWGVVINSGATVLNNQNFLLTTLGFENKLGNRVVNNSSNNYDGGITIVP